LSYFWGIGLLELVLLLSQVSQKPGCQHYANVAKAALYKITYTTDGQVGRGWHISDIFNPEFQT